MKRCRSCGKSCSAALDRCPHCKSIDLREVDAAAEARMERLGQVARGVLKPTAFTGMLLGRAGLKGIRKLVERSTQARKEEEENRNSR